MPRVVNHGERRVNIARAACEAIAAGALEGAALARVAREPGVTTDAIAHDFRDEDHVLEHPVRPLCGRRGQGTSTPAASRPA